jgi:glycosyltransferase involved in cell wall biosynthesis
MQMFSRPRSHDFRSGKKIKILYVCRNYHIGGAEAVVANLCRQIDKERFDVSLFHFLKERGMIGDELHEEGFKTYGISASRIPALKYLTFFQLRRIVIEKEIDIVHSHCTYGLIDSALCKVSSPNLRHLHTFHFGNYPHISKRYLALERFFCKIPDQLVAVGHEQRKVIMKTYGLPPERILTVWNGVVSGRGGAAPEFLEKYGNRKGVIIGVIATLIEQKGLTDMLEVASELKRRGVDAIFLVVGEGHLRKELESKARDLELGDTVQFLGWVMNADSRILPLFDILFQPSLWEAMSMVVLEAMAGGKPIVATDVGENRHMVKYGENGFLVAPRDIASMADALEALTKNPDLLKRQGLESRRRFQEKFTSEAMVRKYEDLYARLGSS